MGISKQVRDESGKIKRVGNYAHVKARRKRTRDAVIAFGGGRCQVCKYDKCLRNLHFHHLDPAMKSFTLSMSGKSIGNLIEEARKCILVCANCHGEIHEGVVDPNNFTNRPVE